MSTFAGSVFWFIVTLGVLVTFHEFGHFWVARRLGVRVVTFSIGFGKALWSRRGADGTQYQLAAIPLGGYVKFLDGREFDLRPGDERVAFDTQPVWKRILIVLAGPVANLILCIALLWGALQWGVPELAADIGKPSGLAAEAGFEAEDRLLAIDGRDVFSWETAFGPLTIAAIDRRPVSVTVRDARGELHERRLDLSRLPADFDQTDPLQAVGLNPLFGKEPPVVGSVVDDTAAFGVLQANDRIVAIDGHPITKYDEIPPRVQASKGKPLALAVRRDGKLLSLSLSPRWVEDRQGKGWRIGVSTRVLARYDAWPALGESLRRTGEMARDNLTLIGRLVTGQASTKNVSGVITIGQVANAEAAQGFGRMLAFMAALSLVLCVMNLLPIPVLDGGHLLYYLIELVSGRPLSDRTLIAGQYLGLALLAGLITLAFYNDIHQLVF